MASQPPPARSPSRAELLAALSVAVDLGLERTYSKIGVTNRIGASMYALGHGLVEPQ